MSIHLHALQPRVWNGTYGFTRFRLCGCVKGDETGVTRSKAQIAEGMCPGREDGQHCDHWWDSEGEPCCGCGDNTPTHSY